MFPTAEKVTLYKSIEDGRYYQKLTGRQAIANPDAKRFTVTTASKKTGAVKESVHFFLPVTLN